MMRYAAVGLYLSSAGAILVSYGYNAFGILVQNSGSGTPPTPFLYCGEEGYQWDRVYWMTVGQRQLDAINGSWANRDPIGIIGGLNEYGYVGNNPATHFDATGLQRTGPRVQSLPIARACHGTCGPNADDWLIAELRWQMQNSVNYRNYFVTNNGSNQWGNVAYIRWANANQMYKYRGWFQFSQGLGKTCGTGMCGYTLYICGTCVKSDVLGNIMFGFVANHLRLNIDNVTGQVSRLRGGSPREKKQQYALGDDIRTATGPNANNFCAQFNKLAPKHSLALFFDEDGLVDSTTCQQCGSKITAESHHGMNGKYTEEMKGNPSEPGPAGGPYMKK